MVGLSLTEVEEALLKPSTSKSVLNRSSVDILRVLCQKLDLTPTCSGRRPNVPIKPDYVQVLLNYVSASFLCLKRGLTSIPENSRTNFAWDCWCTGYLPAVTNRRCHSSKWDRPSHRHPATSFQGIFSKTVSLRLSKNPTRDNSDEGHLWRTK